jgi:hypothetical protein
MRAEGNYVIWFQQDVCLCSRQPRNDALDFWVLLLQSVTSLLIRFLSSCALRMQVQVERPHRLGLAWNVWHCAGGSNVVLVSKRMLAHDARTGGAGMARLPPPKRRCSEDRMTGLNLIMTSWCQMFGICQEIVAAACGTPTLCSCRSMSCVCAHFPAAT